MSQVQLPDACALELPYFAYGSNMNLSVRSRRKLFPKKCWPCTIPGWKISFTLHGMPWIEPCFANIEPISPDEKSSHPDVHGIVMSITGREFRTMVLSEGGGGMFKQGYLTYKINALLYNNEKMEVYTLVCPTSQSSSRQGLYFLPTRRYVKVVVEGAMQCELNPQYIEFLNKQPVYAIKKHMPNDGTKFLLSSIIVPMSIVSTLSKFGTNS